MIKGKFYDGKICPKAIKELHDSIRPAAKYFLAMSRVKIVSDTLYELDGNTYTEEELVEKLLIISRFGIV